MGHVRLGRLPSSGLWQEVVALLHEGADTEEIAIAASEAAEATIQAAAQDATTVHAVWLLTQLPMAARYAHFDERLRDLGLNVSGPPDLGRLMRALAGGLDDYRRAAGAPNDLGELAIRAALGALSTSLEKRIPGLLGAGPDDVRQALRSIDGKAGFSEVTEQFAANLSRNVLGYFLSRELSNHVGPGCRFGTVADRWAFDRRLDQHCREAARIVRVFGGDWFAKRKFTDVITPEVTAKFTRVLGRKISAELQRRRRHDA